MLGADEFGFATAPLIAAGCIMMRKCHLNTCPVGIATQDPVLRARFTGTPEHVINYFFFVAEELREIMAGLGVRTLDEMIGRADLLDAAAGGRSLEGAAASISSRLLHLPPTARARWRNDAPISPRCRHARSTAHLIAALDGAAAGADRARGRQRRPQRRRDGLGRGRAALRPCRPARRQPSTRVLTGTAGQSFGAFLARGVTLELIGDANDYVGKGLSGGRLIVRQPDGAPRDAAANIIVGNTCLYGAIDGEAFFAGVAGERFAVRNSGAVAVVEGAGDHGCEYMTGGVVVVLGAGRPQFRRRHVGRHRLCLRSRRPARGAVQSAPSVDARAGRRSPTALARA